MVTELEDHPEWDCATAGWRPQAWGDTDSDGYRQFLPLSSDQNIVKVQVTEDDQECDWIAHDFRRNASLFVSEDDRGYIRIWAHIGIYVYRREALLKYAAAGPCQREQEESLEQLRALHIGLKMGVVLWEGEHHGGIDTKTDYDAFVARWKAAHP